VIVYKYVSAGALRGVLASQRMGFTHPADFNDPFDRPRVLRSPYGTGMNTIFDGYLTGEQMAQQADDAWAKCAVASFTRTYDNGLMWSHYADSHKGAVIEIDADRAALTALSLLLPIQFGAVVYTKRPNRGTYGRGGGRAEVGERRFDIGNYELLQRLFLSKPIAWAYEEEVRAVTEPHRRFWTDEGQTPDGLWEKIELPGKTIYGLRLPRGSITRVFAGARYAEHDWLTEKAAEFGFGIMSAAPSFDEYDLNFESLVESTLGNLPPIW
jgi:hypothetical protein